MTKYFSVLLLILFIGCLAGAVWFAPTLSVLAGAEAPPTVSALDNNADSIEAPCANDHPEWRQAQVIDGVSIAESPICDADNPYAVALAVKGSNNVSMATLMQTDIAQDALILGEDLDQDGDPDVINIKLEVAELNGSSPDGSFLMNTFAISPGLQPGLWVYTPKSRGMAIKGYNSTVAAPMLRAPSPTIRVEQGDKVVITLENTHYLPHTIHLHGVDHPWLNSEGHDNDGVEEHPVLPGEQHRYEIQPRHAGTMLYHCHVQTAQHLMMGLSGLFVVEENRPNNWVQTFNIGAGQVRHPSVAVAEHYDQEYDLFYHTLIKELSGIIQHAVDPRLIAERMSRQFNITESFENYYLLNGRSFPYTLRDSLIVAGDNETLKLRVGNMQRSPVALHIHGHKATITAYDGMELPEGQQITRDVFDIAPAQRIDLALKTQNNGVNSYGPGLWMFHDHVPDGTTTDGMEPGGNMAILAYKGLLDERGMPKSHDEMLSQVFNKDYYAKNKPVWMQGDFAKLLGDAGKMAPNYVRIVAFGLCLGLAIGIMLYVLIARARKSDL